ncbi:hypothetical protein ACFWWC_18620 [Streptomyces sp. NPDC058642]|uniref:hypothetical protein n=1 Tax=Streptomyces sp. NPDC058642 TaxID=3346572 RepID=UPI0036523EC3
MLILIRLQFRTREVRVGDEECSGNGWGTSNRASGDWYPLFPNPLVAESLLDGLINTSHQVIMNGPNYRPNKSPRNPTGKIGPATARTDDRRSLPLGI